MKIYNLSKPYLVLFFLIFFYQNVSYCQEKYKFGEVSMEEMEMKTYPNDSSVNAVVLYEDGYTNFDYEDGFILSKELKERIKILKQEGVDLATVTTTYRVEGSDKERILDIEACAYNFEHGKIVTSKLDKKFIFEEKLSDNVYQVKFAIPNVKVGTVFEYKI